MKKEDYMKAVFSKLNQNQEITCEDCGRKAMISHAIVDHEENRVKIVCNDCFLNGYKDLLYSEVEWNA
jgi:hypothetical protein